MSKLSKTHSVSRCALTRAFRGAVWSALIFHTSIGCETVLAAPQDGSGLQVSGAVDIVGGANTGGGNAVSDRLDVREAEILLFAPIDHLFDGTFSAAAHREEGKYLFEIHEAHIGSSRLIPNFHFKLGQFFLGVGRLNQVHRHEWPFVSAPKVHREFFGEEGAIDSGGEVGFLLPASFYLDLTGGLTNGWTYGHTHNEGAKPEVSTHYLRLTSFLPVSDSGDIQAGLNYLGRKSSTKVQTTLLGFDLVGKWKEASSTKYLLQSELWHRTLRTENTKPEETLGFYFYAQYGFSSQISLGLRLDTYSVLSLEDATGQRLPNLEYAFVPTLTYKPSEFSTLRVSYNQFQVMRNNSTTSSTGAIEIQAAFVIGSHPSHSF